MQRGVFPQFKVNELATFPIPKRISEYQDILVEKVQDILTRKLENPESKTLDLDQIIDYIIYDIYNLTEQEINLIEET